MLGWVSPGALLFRPLPSAQHDVESTCRAVVSLPAGSGQHLPGPAPLEQPPSPPPPAYRAYVSIWITEMLLEAPWRGWEVPACLLQPTPRPGDAPCWVGPWLGGSQGGAQKQEEGEWEGLQLCLEGGR